MSDDTLQRQLEEAQETIRALQHELEETNRGLVALTLEVERKNEESRAISQQLWQTAKLATMGELAASIAHELNNPLATVSLNVESLLMELPADAPERQALGVIAQEVERMGSLVGNLLQFSRRSGAQLSTLAVRDELENTLELIRYHLRNHNIAVVWETDPGVPMILADRQQLRQVFLNLFTNASDAMPEGGTLTVRVKRSEEAEIPNPQSGIVIEVADTGAGIPPENLPKVLEPFFTTKPEGKGTGLGLPICKRIVQEHGGTLEILSAGVPGKGTTVRLTLPLGAGEKPSVLEE